MSVMTNVNEVRTFDILDEKGPSDMFAGLYNNVASSDVKLLVDNVEIHAHKAILMERNSYFKTLFSCGMRESRENRVELKETPFQAFQLLIKYIYTGKMQIPVNQIQLLLNVMELANKYDFPEVKNKIANFLKENITFDYAFEILNTSSKYNLDELKNASLDFIAINTEKCINKESFLNISFDTLCEILDHHLCAEEMDIVNATKKWIAANNPEASKIFEIFKHIHLSSISVAEYNSLLVTLSSYFTSENLLEFIKEQDNAHNSGTESCACRTIKNVATIEKGAQVIEGLSWPDALQSASEVLFNGETNSNRSVYHNLGEKSITIQLGRPYFLESLGFALWPGKHYSFYIEVSKDKNTWKKLGQYEKLKGWQVVRFRGQFVQYIRFVSTEGRGLTLIHFECPAQQRTIEEAAKNV